MEFPDLLTRWTALGAMAGAALVLVCRLSLRSMRNEPLRWLWTVSCGVFLLHVACAFHFYHHWSHTDAYETTARRTQEMVGVASGSGLYLNYVFAALWPADVLWWWCAPRSYRERPRWLTWTYGFFFAFMAVNATIVFGGSVARITGCICCVAILLTVFLSYRSHKSR